MVTATPTLSVVPVFVVQALGKAIIEKDSNNIKATENNLVNENIFVFSSLFTPALIN